MTKKNPPEIICFSPNEIDKFMQAVENASERTMISNTSVFKKNDREVEIYETRSFFLIQIGIEFHKILKKEEDNKRWARVKNHLKESK